MDLLLTRDSKRGKRVFGTLYVDGEFACQVAESGKLVPKGEHDVLMYIICDRYIDYEKFPWSEPYHGQIPIVSGFDSAICADGSNAREYSDIVVVNENGEPDEQSFKSFMRKYFNPAEEAGETVKITIK